MKTGEISRRSVMAGAAGLAGLAAVVSSVEIVRAQGKTILKARAKRDIDALDPGYMVGGAEIDVQFATMPRLAHVVKQGDVYTWGPSDYVDALEQTDATRFEFALKPGFAWTNGYGEVSAEDVKYSFERLLQSDWKKKWAALDHVEVTGSHSGVIVLKYPFAAFGVSALAAGHGCLVCKKATEAVGGKYTTEIPATCGPYLVREWTPKQRMVFSRNPDWKGKKPPFDEIQVYVVTELAAAELAFEGGELDITGISPEAMLRYRERPPANSEVTIAGYLTYGWLGMNTEHPKLSDVRVRKAIQHAVDVDSALAATFSGAAEKSHGIVPPGILGKRNSSGYSYDPERARALLQEAGVSTLALELRTENLQPRLVMAQVIQANLAEVGIQVDVIPMDTGPFKNLGRESKGDAWKDLQIYVNRFGTGLDPSDAFVWFTQDQIGNWNWERWSDPEFEELFRKGSAETAPAKRTEIYLRMQEIMEQTGAYVWLQHEPEPFVHRANITPVILPTGDTDFRRFERV